MLVSPVLLRRECREALRDSHWICVGGLRATCRLWLMSRFAYGISDAINSTPDSIRPDVK